MTLLRLLLILCLLAAPLPAAAGDNAAPRGKAWVQVSSHAALEEAVAQAEDYAAEFEFTRVFLADSGWYAVTLGIVPVREAQSTLAKLKRARRVPRDAETRTGEDYVTEIWSAQRAASEGTGYAPEIAGAIAAERALGGDDRRALQLALLWIGTYGGAVDGSFGAATRAAIRGFQDRNGSPVTGFLTGSEARVLMAAAAAQQEAVGWSEVEDGPMGLRIGFPAALFREGEESDIGHRYYGSGIGEGAVLSLVSLDGGRDSMAAMLDAARDETGRDRAETVTRDAFSVAGQSGDRLVWSHAITDGRAMRGFILSCEADQVAVFAPIAAALEASLSLRRVSAGPRIEESLGLSPARPDPGARQADPDPREAQDREAPVRRRSGAGDSAAGRVGGPVEPRPPVRPGPESTGPDRPRTERTRPDRRPPAPREEPRKRPFADSEEASATGTGFYVSAEGQILTNHHVVEGCGRMRVNGTEEARVVAVDEDHDLALLAQDTARDPEGVAAFAPAAARLNADVTVVGFPLYGLLGGVNVTRGVVSSLAGLRGDETFIQISAAVQPGNSGGPVIDERGYILGVVQSKLDVERLSRLTGDIAQNINFAIRGEVAQAFLEVHGVTPLPGPDRPALAPADLAEAAQKFTVLLECFP